MVHKTIINTQKIKFNNGVLCPVLGLGTWQGVPDKRDEVEQAVIDAIDIGYRLIDCAHVYRNEKLVGNSIASKIVDGTVNRDDLFVCSKLWNTFHRADLVETGLRKSLNLLGLDYLDLYLVHWPFAFKEEVGFEPKDASGNIIISDVDYIETWKAMEEVYKKGLVRSIGISNFNCEQIERLLSETDIVPVTNQIECNPYLNQKNLRRFCANNDIVVTAYSPLGSRGRPWQKNGDPDILSDNRLAEVGLKYGKQPAQVLLRYQVQLGNITIPKSANRKRLAENIDVFDFELSAEEMKSVDSFDCNARLCQYSEAKDHQFYPFK